MHIQYSQILKLQNLPLLIYLMLLLRIIFIIFSLPFLYENNSSIGLLSLSYFDRFSQIKTENQNNITEKCFEQNELPLLFPSWLNIKDELKESFKFWDLVLLL